MDYNEKLYYKMALIRKTETSIEDLFSKGKLKGTTHGSKGQEAIPVAIAEFIDPEKDYICGGHRSHGHLLSLSGDVKALIAELMTKESGYVHGKGGSQHIRYKNFFCNGITGGMVPVAVGLAFAQKHRKKNNISVVFLGDGAMNEGYVMEAFNLAAVYQLPILFVLENNSYAMSTPICDTIRCSFEDRVNGFGIEYNYMEATNIHEIIKLSKQVIQKVRDQSFPQFIEFKTHRFSGHSKSDKRDYISKEIDEYWRENDPLKKIAKEIGEEKKTVIDNKINEEIEMAIKKASQDKHPKTMEELRNEL